MSKENNYPQYFAQFYDTIYTKLRDDKDKNYFLKKIKQTSGPVLEIGAGTGRIFISALKQGADIYAVDISQSMINILKSKLAAKYHNRLFIQDACTLNMNKKFDLIIAPFRVFSHFIKIADQLKALNAIAKHLNTGGHFIFDVFRPHLGIIAKGIKHKIDFEGEYMEGKKLKRIVSVKPDVLNQINHVTMQFIWQEDNVTKNKDWYFPMRYYFRYELEHLIARSSLNLINILGDYDGNKLNDESADFIMVCKK